MKRLGVLLGLGVGVAAGVRYLRKNGRTDAVTKVADRVKGRLSDARRDQEIDVTSAAPYATESTAVPDATVLTETEPTPGTPTTPTR